MMANSLTLFSLVMFAILETNKGVVLNHHVCEHNNFHLQCSHGQTISVISALYGRQTSTICTNGPINTDNCAAASSLAVVRQRCNGRRTCDISASNGVFGDPCRGTFKYLEIQYSCGGPVPGYTCEHGTFHLQCNVGKSIHVTSALYGRQVSSICTQGSIHTINCAASNSHHIVRQQCNGRRTCSIAASNSVFGDPCQGTFKYLEVDYSCV